MTLGEKYMNDHRPMSELRKIEVAELMTAVVEKLVKLREGLILVRESAEGGKELQIELALEVGKVLLEGLNAEYSTRVDEELTPEETETMVGYANRMQIAAQQSLILQTMGV